MPDVRSSLFLTKFFTQNPFCLIQLCDFSNVNPLPHSSTLNPTVLTCNMASSRQHPVLLFCSSWYLCGGQITHTFYHSVVFKSTTLIFVLLSCLFMVALSPHPSSFFLEVGGVSILASFELSISYNFILFPL